MSCGRRWWRSELVDEDVPAAREVAESVPTAALLMERVRSFLDSV